MLEKKNILLSQLENLQNIKKTGVQKQLISADTKLATSVRYNFEKGYPELVLSTKNSTVIHGVTVKCLKLFEKEFISHFENGMDQENFYFPIISKNFSDAVLHLSIHLGSSIASKELKVERGSVRL